MIIIVFSHVFTHLRFLWFELHLFSSFLFEKVFWSRFANCSCYFFVFICLLSLGFGGFWIEGFLGVSAKASHSALDSKTTSNIPLIPIFVLHSPLIYTPKVLPLHHSCLFLCYVSRLLTCFNLIIRISQHNKPPMIVIRFLFVMKNSVFLCVFAVNAWLKDLSCCVVVGVFVVVLRRVLGFSFLGLDLQTVVYVFWFFGLCILFPYSPLR